jgi:hypothetical protein
MADNLLSSTPGDPKWVILLDVEVDGNLLEAFSSRYSERRKA